jgi:hypothetical protein
MSFPMKLDSRIWALALALIVTTSFCCDLYASVYARGLYADAAALLVVIYEGKSFFLSLSGSRSVVEILRQTPIVLLSKYTSATLFQCGQALTFARCRPCCARCAGRLHHAKTKAGCYSPSPRC